MSRDWESARIPHLHPNHIFPLWLRKDATVEIAAAAVSSAAAAPVPRLGRHLAAALSSSPPPRPPPASRPCPACASRWTRFCRGSAKVEHQWNIIAPNTEADSLKTLLYKMKNFNESKRSLVDLVQNTEVQLEFFGKWMDDYMKGSAMFKKARTNHKKVLPELDEGLDGYEKTPGSMFHKGLDDREKTATMSEGRVTLRKFLLWRHLELGESVEAHLKQNAVTLKKGAKGV
uniref:Uncharacterized protein n=1 Tax=Leersia perrieri TaxID=77586 RepID=A0A0D9WVE6_9ORYZ